MEMEGVALVKWMRVEGVWGVLTAVRWRVSGDEEVKVGYWFGLGLLGFRDRSLKGGRGCG